MKQLLLVITGPTGVGKTDIALQLAQHIPAEIVNADVGQFYEPLTIGTAKPDWQRALVPHHLFDIYNAPKNFTVHEFRNRLKGVILSIQSRNKIPIIVGGSLFYIRSLFFPPFEIDALDHSFQKNKKMSSEIEEKNNWELLNKVDPERASKIHKNDSYRINRALEIWHHTGRKPSSLQPTYDPIIVPFFNECIIRDREDLYQRINERVISMIKHGWIEEVEKLIGTPWESFLMQKKIIGYEVIIEYLKSGKAASHRSELITKIQQRTRQYAKRQLIFLKALEKDLLENINQMDALSKAEIGNLTLMPVELYIEQLLEKVRNRMKV